MTDTVVSLFNFNNFLKNCLQLTKSIVLKHKTQADKLNNYIHFNHPNLIIDENSQTWKYYKNINCIKYTTDNIIYIQSVDNAQTIELTPSALLEHPKTKKELQKYESYYDEVVKRYPYEELYIKSCITDNIIGSYITSDLEDLTIVRADTTLIEEQEDNILSELQNWINNYKVTWFFEQYALVDDLFTAAQVAELYISIFRKIIAIRLNNAKTIRAHSFHIESFLSSILKLDEQYKYLNYKQKFYFYRNLLYLNNHVGSNQTFNRLISILFDERKIALETFDYKIKNNLIGYDTDYTFTKRKLNHINITYDSSSYNLAQIENIETNLAPSNKEAWEINRKNIDQLFKFSINDILYTKDLSSIFYNYTDNVPYTLFETIVNTWGYMVDKSKTTFIVVVYNTQNNTNVPLTNADAYKFFIYLLYKYNGIELNNFPQVYINHVIEPNIDSIEELLELCYRVKFYYRSEIQKLLLAIPTSSTIYNSTNVFYNYISQVYLYNIAIWIYLSNLHDLDDNGQFEKIIDRFYRNEIIELGTENISDFLKRINFEEAISYNKEKCFNVLNKIIDYVYDNKYFDFLSFDKTQKAIIEVFKKITSYTIQFTTSSTNQNPLLCRNDACRYSISSQQYSQTNFINETIINLEGIEDSQSSSGEQINIEFTCNNTINTSSSKTDVIDICVNCDSNIEINESSNILLTLNVDLDIWQWTPTTLLQEDLRFLALNP